MQESSEMNVVNYNMEYQQIHVWSMNTISIICLPLCLLTCHISVIRTVIFQVSFLVGNSEIMFTLRDIATNII